jgi:hypothetical protein
MWWPRATHRRRRTRKCKRFCSCCEISTSCGGWLDLLPARDDYANLDRAASWGRAGRGQAGEPDGSRRGCEGDSSIPIIHGERASVRRKEERRGGRGRGCSNELYSPATVEVNYRQLLRGPERWDRNRGGHGRAGQGDVLDIALGVGSAGRRGECRP